MFAIASLVFASSAVQSVPIKLDVDATDIGRNIIRVVEELPATDLVRFPKWMPGDHAPDGPLRNAIMFHAFADGKEIKWRRDGVDLYDIHLDIPQGAQRLRLEFIDGEAIGDVATSLLGRIKWGHAIFLPKGPVDRIPVRVTLKVPTGWQAFDSLPFKRMGDTLQFEDTNAERLIDSPVMMGKYAASYPAGEGHELDIVGDDPKNVAISPETVSGMKNIVDETLAVWGAKHYNSYKWLLTVSNFGAFDGLEHNECSEDGVGADGIMGGLTNSGLADLLCHEYTHSWNGKYRRPAGLSTPDYATPQQGELLWVYEGMTQYWGYILPARAGFWNAEHLHDVIAADAARLAIKDGRKWKSTADTAVAASIDRHPSAPWALATRGQDYYQEGVLLWVGIDATLRRLTNGQKNLNDFCHLFGGGQNTEPEIVSYTREDIVRLLNQVAPYDWAGYIQKMVYDVHPTPTTEGLEMAGWRLVFNSTPGPVGGHFYDLGMDVGSDGMINDMLIGSAADQAKVAPGMKILTVNNKPFSDGNLNDAVTAGMKPGNPIVLEVVKDDVVSVVRIDYTGGLKYAHLEAIPGATDYLSQIATPVVKHDNPK